MPSPFAYVSFSGGKTLTAIATIGAGYQMGHLKRVLIAAPTSAAAVWLKEFDEYAAFPHTIQEDY